MESPEVYSDTQSHAARVFITRPKHFFCLYIYRHVTYNDNIIFTHHHITNSIHILLCCCNISSLPDCRGTKSYIHVNSSSPFFEIFHRLRIYQLEFAAWVSTFQCLDLRSECLVVLQHDLHLGLQKLKPADGILDWRRCSWSRHCVKAVEKPRSLLSCKSASDTEYQ